MKPLEIKGESLARNTLLNLISKALPLLVGVITIPSIVRGLGIERFGLLSLAWVVLGYFTIFDLGLGRATTRYVAKALGKGEIREISHIVWTSVLVQTILGLLGTFILVMITPLITERILNTSPGLAQEAKTTFYVLALAIPIVLVSSSFAGLLEASQRFDLVNTVRIPSSVLTFLLPLVGLIFDFHLPGIVVLIFATRLLALLTLTALAFRVFPTLRKFSTSFALFYRLLKYGSWVTVTSIVGPILLYLDRFLIALLLSMSAVAYYTAPHEVVSRLCIIPASLTITLFPSFSTLEGIGDVQKIGTLFTRSVKYILLLLGLTVLILMLFAREILQMWLGKDFSMQSTGVLQILAFGILINSLAHIPYTLLHGVGRPDITAKFHLFELPFYIGLAWVLINQWSIAGAAAAWTIRIVVDTLLLFVASFKVCRLSPRLLTTNRLTLTTFVLFLLSGAAYALKSLIGSFPLFIQSLLFIALFSLFVWVVWRNVLDDSDRGTLLRIVKVW